MERLGLGYEDAEAGESAARLRLDHRVRPGRAVRRAARLRHAGAGDQRLHEHHRLPRQPAHALGPVHLRLLRGHALRVQHRVGAALPRPHRQGPAHRHGAARQPAHRPRQPRRALHGRRRAPHARRQRLVRRLELRRLSDDRRPRGRSPPARATRCGGASARSSAGPSSRAIPSSPRPRRGATAATRSPRIIQGWTSARSKAEVVGTLATGGVPAAPVNNVAEMVADPQVQAREMFVEVDHPDLRTAQDDGHAAQALGDARPDPLARPACRASTTRRSSSGCWATPRTTSRAGARRA